MKLKENNSAQKLRGAYYTPLPLAEMMVKLFSSDESIKTVLEPSCGDGVFIDALDDMKMLEQLNDATAIEIEQDEVEKLKHRFANSKKIEIINRDFFDYYENTYEKKFDLILGNPPYIRYQYLEENQRILMSEILVSQGMKSNRLVNTWVGFMVACVNLLSDNGKIAFVIPAEILQVAYAEDLRLFLANHLSKITLITFEELVFPDIEQEIVVFIGEKGTEEKGIRIIELNNLDDLNDFDIDTNGFQKLQHVHEKWTKYFTNNKENELISKIRKDNRFQMLSDTALINVGITTGNNKYFSVNDKTVRQYELEKHKEYIHLGEVNGENKGYKCSIRDRWYRIPSVWVPDAFFLRRNNLYPKFVLNCCNAVSTDTMHRIKFNDGVEPERILLSYYNSISFAFTELCGRSYGGGVLEILPREVGNILVPKLDDIPIESVRKVLRKVDQIVREDEPIENALDIVDREILINSIGIEEALCKDARAIWKKLQRRRLKRG